MYTQVKFVKLVRMYHVTHSESLRRCALKCFRGDALVMPQKGLLIPGHSNLNMDVWTNALYIIGAFFDFEVASSVQPQAR